jgi:hypothetical protein
LGYFADELKPTLTLSAPRTRQQNSLQEIRVGMFDAYSGINVSSFSVTATFPVK